MSVAQIDMPRTGCSRRRDSTLVHRGIQGVPAAIQLHPVARRQRDKPRPVYESSYRLTQHNLRKSSNACQQTDQDTKKPCGGRQPTPTPARFDFHRYERPPTHDATHSLSGPPDACPEIIRRGLIDVCSGSIRRGNFPRARTSNCVYRQANIRRTGDSCLLGLLSRGTQAPTGRFRKGHCSFPGTGSDSGCRGRVNGSVKRL